MFSKLLPPRKSQQEKKREEKKLFAGTRVIVLSDFSEHFDQWGMKKRTPCGRDLGKVVETVTFLEGGEAGVNVKVMFLELPKPQNCSQEEKEEWQANDFHPVLAIEERDPFFRDYRMLMRLDARTELPWIDGEIITVSYKDIRQATYVEWMKLVVVK